MSYFQHLLHFKPVAFLTFTETPSISSLLNPECIILFALTKKKIVEIPIPTRYAEESTSPSVSQTIKYSGNVISDLIKIIFHKCRIVKQKKFLLD